MRLSHHCSVRLCLLALAGFVLQLLPLEAQELVWARQTRGSQEAFAYDVALDPAGNIYTTGFFLGTVDFDPGPGVANLTSAGSDDVFVSKFDNDGNFVWAKRFGSSQTDQAIKLAVDADGNVYTTGFFGSAGSFQVTADFDPGPGIFNLTAEGFGDSFVSKLDADGSFVWAKRLGGPLGEGGNDVAVDASGNVYVAGGFSGTSDFDPGPGVTSLTSAGQYDSFVVKLDAGGNYVWALRTGSAGFDFTLGIETDASGNIYTSGYFALTVDFGGTSLTSEGEGDIVVAKRDNDGQLLWARRTGGTGDDYAQGLALDPTGAVVSTGRFSGVADFDPGPDIVNLTSAGGSDIFVWKLDSAGALVWAQRMGGTGGDGAFGIDVDSSGNTFTAGYFSGTADFDPGGGIHNLNAVGLGDIFLSKINSSGGFVWANGMGSAATDEAYAAATDDAGAVYAAGQFRLTTDFDPGPDVVNLSSAGLSDTFVAKYTAGDAGVMPPFISEGGIVLANLLPKINTVSPLSIISVFGQNFSTETILFPNLDGGGKLDTILGGTCLMMNGERLPIFAMTPGQINAQVSAAKAFGPASFTVVSNCGTAAALSSAPLLLESPTPRAAASNVETATVEAATPGFFIFNPIAEDGFIAARFNATDAQPPVPVAPANVFPNDSFGPSRPAEPGDIIVMYGTGWGDTSASLDAGELAGEAAELPTEANVMISFGGVILDPSDVLYVGVTPAAAGLLQAVIRIPANAQPGNNQVVLTAYGKSTPTGPVIPVAVP